MAGGKKERPIVIKKEEVVEGGHHGGAWKVAYADFVTAMMAFFLLMWLLNATTQTQRDGLADYFAPSHAMSRGSSGVGMPFGGKTPNSEGSLISDRGSVRLGREMPVMVPEDEDAEDPVPVLTPRSQAEAQKAGGRADDGAPEPLPGSSAGSGRAPKPPAAPGPSTTADVPADAEATAMASADASLRNELGKREQAAFEKAAQQIRDAVRSDPALAELGRQLTVEVTPEGLRVQLLDAERQPMFSTGSAQPNERARTVLAKVAVVLGRLPQPVAITGHTDAAPFKGGERSNWDLSTERANATRRLLLEAGLSEARIRSVSGMADRDLLLPEDGMAAANRRIAITVLHDRQAADEPAAKDKDKDKAGDSKAGGR